MKKLIILGIVGASLLFYFTLAVFVLPDIFLANEQLVSEPFLTVEVSDSEISLGESFRINIDSENRGEHGDIHIVSVAFPDLDVVDDIVSIATYDFRQSPTYIVPGDEIGAKYSGGLESVIAQYPSIEAMSRPAFPGSQYNLDLVITPKETGVFSVYVKAINIPHVTEKSHFPHTGILDHQNEHVLVYLVNVNP